MIECKKKGREGSMVRVGLKLNNLEINLLGMRMCDEIVSTIILMTING